MVSHDTKAKGDNKGEGEELNLASGIRPYAPRTGYVGSRHDPKEGAPQAMNRIVLLSPFDSSKTYTNHDL